MNTVLADVAKAMVAPGKGILAADESFGTANKRFEKLGIPTTEEMRRSYREMLFTTKDLASSISAVILFDETIRQGKKDGTSFVQVLERNGILPGIKLDLGTVTLPNTHGEKVTEGLDGLAKRVAEYVGLGAKFAKWRAVIDVGPAIPSDRAIEANAHALARYAAICQAGGLVPIVEPEVLMDGDHTLERCREVTERTLKRTFWELAKAGVILEQMVLKPNMVISGMKCPTQAGVLDVSKATLETLLRTVPAAVAGVAFLSGGQSDEIAAAHLNEINRLAKGRAPWPITFSYGRALHQSAMTAWRGSDAHWADGQAALSKRARCNAAAASGRYSAETEKELTPA
ncbi:MAG TPA: class I fructose-bisphosphate aldolase [Candidatus Baltobacteraceae bacterium]|jgi:fructose-bisphosphate aldolase class I|nr:class I fructose-bisphosphate aldolase [Candidatus Baltobacteraceae bacterium]